MKLDTSASPRYKEFLKPMLMGQAILFLLTLLIMDFGQANLCAIAAINAQFAGVCIIVWRRPLAPTYADELFFRFGSFAAWTLGLFFAHILNIWMNGKTLIFWLLGLNGPRAAQMLVGVSLVVLLWIAFYTILVLLRRRAARDPQITNEPRITT